MAIRTTKPQKMWDAKIEWVCQYVAPSTGELVVFDPAFKFGAMRKTKAAAIEAMRKHVWKKAEKRASRGNPLLVTGRERVEKVEVTGLIF